MVETKVRHCPTFSTHEKIEFRVRQQLGCLVVSVGRSTRPLAPAEVTYELYVWYLAVALSKQLNSTPYTPGQRSSTFQYRHHLAAPATWNMLCDCI